MERYECSVAVIKVAHVLNTCIVYIVMKAFLLEQLMYGTDLTQRCTRIRVTGHRSPSARTRSSISFNGLELELERKPRVSS